MNIFHPTDLSPASAVAFRHALRLSLDEGALLTIMHVHGIWRAETSWREFPAVRTTADAWHAVGGHLPGVRKIEAEAGNVAKALSAYLKTHRADLIVLASHRRGGLSAWLKPSVSAALVRASRLPALIVPEGTEGFVGVDGTVRLRDVVVAVAENPDPQIGVDSVNAVFERIGTTPDRVILLHAGKTEVHHPPVAPTAGATRYETISVPGEPANAIVTASASSNADLIVMTTSGHDSLADTLLGSTFDLVMKKARCPLLVIPAPRHDTSSSG